MLKTIWLYSVKYYLKIGLFFYFRRIQVYGIEHIPENKATLILCNHQNALLDALLIASRLDQFAYFLTRAGVFKKQFVSKLLNSFKMLPVYRIRDGWTNLTHNNPVFEKCQELLNQNRTVVIFPEGSHNLARCVRPLSKGFTRIVFDTLETYPKTDLKLVPIGLNFRNAKEFVDSVSMFIAEPIDASTYISSDRNQDVSILRQDIHAAISKLTTHIPMENYDETISRLDAMKVDYLNPKVVNQCIANNFIDCKSSVPSTLNGLRSILKFLLKLNLALPYILWKLWIQPKIKELEFTATFRFAVAITLVPLYLIGICIVLNSFFGMQVALTYFMAVVALALITVKL